MHWFYTNKMVKYLSKRFRTVNKNNHAMIYIEGYIIIYMYVTLYIYIYIYIYN